MACDPAELYNVLNKGENEVQQAMRAAKRSDFAKVWTDIEQAVGFLNQAKALCHDDVPHEHPEDPPVEEPPHDHEPPPAPSAADILASSVVAVPTTFDKSAWIGSRSLHTTGENAPDKGAFRLTGNISHLNYDDAIVFPGLPGAAHLHMYWGNTRAGADSTYESLRSTGNSTVEGGPLLRSSYWMPAPLLGDIVALPDYITMYYKRVAQMDHPMPEGVERLSHIPRGLRMITRRGKLVVRKLNGQVIEQGIGHPITRFSPTPIPVADILAQIEPGDNVQIILDFPAAWDGKRVAAADHMSHMSHIDQRNNNTGQMMMPETHPVLIADIREILSFTAQPGEDWTLLELSSDRAMAASPLSTLHGDYFEAHDDDIRAEWHANAIERRLNCSGGDMGSGRGLKRPPSFSFNQKPNRIPLSAIPVGGEYRLID